MLNKHLLLEGYYCQLTKDTQWCELLEYLDTEFHPSLAFHRPWGHEITLLPNPLTLEGIYIYILKEEADINCESIADCMIYFASVVQIQKKKKECSTFFEDFYVL